MMVSAYVKKLDETFERDWSKLPAATQEHVADYGFRQLVADSHASVKREGYDSDEAFTADVKSAVTARLAQIDSGDFTRTRTVNPTTAKISAAVKEAGIDISTIDPAKLVTWLKRQAEQGRAA